MDLYEWAKKEVDIACNDRSGYDDTDEYYRSCCESALKSYKCLLEDGHSGMSWSITKKYFV